MMELERMLTRAFIPAAKPKQTAKMYRAYTGKGKTGYERFGTYDEAYFAAKDAAARLGYDCEYMRQSDHSARSFVSYGCVRPDGSRTGSVAG